MNVPMSSKNMRLKTPLIPFPGGPVGHSELPIQEVWVQSLGWEDLLEKEMATHSNILAWKILWTEEPGRLQSMGSDTTEQLHSLMP